EAVARGLAEQPFQRLRLDLHPLEGGLLRGTATVGSVPVAVIHLPAPLLARHAPVGDLMQRTAEVIQGEDDAVHWLLLGGRQVNGLAPAAHETGIAGNGKASVEQADQVLAIMDHGTGEQTWANW